MCIHCKGCIAYINFCVDGALPCRALKKQYGGHENVRENVQIKGEQHNGKDRDTGWYYHIYDDGVYSGGESEYALGSGNGQGSCFDCDLSGFLCRNFGNGISCKLSVCIGAGYGIECLLCLYRMRPDGIFLENRIDGSLCGGADFYRIIPDQCQRSNF